MATTLDPFAPVFFPETYAAGNPHHPLPLHLFPVTLSATQGYELSCNKDAVSYHYFHSPYLSPCIPHPYTSPALFPCYEPPLKISTAQLLPPLIHSYTAIEPPSAQVSDGGGVEEQRYNPPAELVDEQMERHDSLQTVAASRMVARGPRGGGGRHRLLRRSSPALCLRWIPKSSSPDEKPFVSIPKLEDFRFSDEVAEQTGKSTVMVKNIPNKFSFRQVLEMLDDHCLEVNKKIEEEAATASANLTPVSQFDFLYLPMDFVSGNNLGYAFVNFTNSLAARRLYRELHMKSWDEFGSRKICEVTHARIQGLEGLLRHFRNSVFTCSSAEYLPVFYEPGRDGYKKPLGRRIGKLVQQPHP